MQPLSILTEYAPDHCKIQIANLGKDFVTRIQRNFAWFSGLSSCSGIPNIVRIDRYEGYGKLMRDSCQVFGRRTAVHAEHLIHKSLVC